MLDYMIENKHDLRYIIAPHDISKEHVSSLKSKLKGNAILYSEIPKRQNESILIIDSIGMLSRIYKYADITYIGGAFKEGLHNILEPAAYGKPVITGPNHSGFLEGPAMEKAEALFRVEDDAMFRSVMNTLIGDEIAYKKASKAAQKFIMDNRGASKKTTTIIEGYSL
jgi:3-deoxy-D-manno-octulosonic-acid transferase